MIFECMMMVEMLSEKLEVIHFNKISEHGINLVFATIITNLFLKM